MRTIDLARKRRGNKPFFLDANGVTIKLKAGYPVGTVGQADGDVSGKIYTAVDDITIRQLDPITDDHTSVCTTLVTDVSQLFLNVSSFNQNISSWDVSSVLDMEQLFEGATFFNQNIGSWDTSNVTKMFAVFENATSFNQDISNWCVEFFQSKPVNFDFDTSSLWTNDKKPNWGVSC